VYVPKTYTATAEHTEMTRSDNQKEITSKIKLMAQNNGFDAVGICKAENMDEDWSIFNRWLKEGRHSVMTYLKKHSNLRKNPSNLFDKAKSVIVVIKNYNCEDSFSEEKYSVAKYAYGKDYHLIIKKKLKSLLNEIKQIYPQSQGRYFTDTAPLLERSLAVRAGLGFIGKNTCLINKDIGSYCFIGVVLLDLELNSDSKISGDCESCDLCITSCPTGALSTKGLDARLCISCHTIENKNPVPDEIASKIKNQIFGCDICQNVCPYNRDKKYHSETEFEILKQIKNLNPKRLQEMSDDEFKTLFGNTPLYRAGRLKLIDNFKNIV